MVRCFDCCYLVEHTENYFTCGVLDSDFIENSFTFDEVFFERDCKDFQQCVNGCIHKCRYCKVWFDCYIATGGSIDD